MSTLVTNTIKSNTANPPLFQNTSGTEIGTLCRAWVNFNGTPTTPSIFGSYNVSSVTKNSTGRYTVNFTNALLDANYSAISTNTNNEGGCFSHTTSSVNVFVNNASGAVLDSLLISCAVFR
jgi:hypothetical protein